MSELEKARDALGLSLLAVTRLQGREAAQIADYVVAVARAAILDAREAKAPAPDDGGEQTSGDRARAAIAELERDITAICDGKIKTLPLQLAERREKAKTAHPDKGGSAAAMTALNQARDAAKREIGA